MSRPSKSGLDYFPHDTDATTNEKLEVLQSLYGNDGYAFYFKLCERIYHSENAELDVSNADAVALFCRKYLLIPPERFQEILRIALKLGCFDAEAYEQRKVLTSEAIKRIAGVVFEKRKEMQERYGKRRDQSLPDSDPLVSDAKTAILPQKPGFSSRKPISDIEKGFPFTRESKVKESQDININNISAFGVKGDQGEERDLHQVSAAEISEDMRREAGEVWSKVLHELERQVSKANYRTWLEKSRGLLYDGQFFVVGVPNSFVADYLNKNLCSLIEKTLIEVTKSECGVFFLVENG